MSKFKEEIKDLLKPYLREEAMVDYVAFKVEQLHKAYQDVEEEE